MIFKIITYVILKAEIRNLNLLRMVFDQSIDGERHRERQRDRETERDSDSYSLFQVIAHRNLLFINYSYKKSPSTL